MSRFTLYLCLLVGLIAVVSAASLDYNDAQLSDELPVQKCIKEVTKRCSVYADPEKKEECIAAGVKKYCHGDQDLS